MGCGPPASVEDGPRTGEEYRQSRRGAIYARHSATLDARGLTYPCYCTPLELDLSRKAQLAAGRPPRYAGTCRELSAEARVRKSAQGISPTTRFRVPTGKCVEFDDMVHGAQRFATDDIGDFILRRADGSAAFFFSNAIDDAEMGITHVLRGEDHLTNTPRQLLVLEALGLRAPTYGHLSLLVGADGAPLSKRHGATSVREFRERGYLPVALANHLFRLGHSSSENGVLAPEHMARAFHRQASRPRAGAFRGIAAQCLAARSGASHAARGKRTLARVRDASRHRRRPAPRVHRGNSPERGAAVRRGALARGGIRAIAVAGRIFAGARARSGTAVLPRGGRCGGHQSFTRRHRRCGQGRDRREGPGAVEAPAPGAHRGDRGTRTRAAAQGHARGQYPSTA